MSDHDYRTEARILRALYVASDYDPALLTDEQKDAVRELLDEADEVLNFTTQPTA